MAKDNDVGKRKHFIQIIATLTLLGVFAMSSILVAVMGAEVYKHSADNLQANYGTRTSLVYMSEKIRQTAQGSVRVDTLQGGDALVLSETYGDETYESWIYVYDGYLREVLIPAGAELTPSDGQRIMELQSMHITRDDTLMHISIKNSRGDTDALTINGRMAI